jgi:hypothetical protein
MVAAFQPYPGFAVHDRYLNRLSFIFISGDELKLTLGCHGSKPHTRL